MTTAKSSPIDQTTRQARDAFRSLTTVLSGVIMMGTACATGHIPETASPPTTSTLEPVHSSIVVADQNIVRVVFPCALNLSALSFSGCWRWRL